MGSGHKVEALIEEGLRHYGHNEEPQAIRCWKEALSLDPSNAQARDFLISAGINVDELRPTENKVPEPPASPVDTTTAPLHQHVAELMKQGKFEEALTELDTARTLYPEDVKISRTIRNIRDRLVLTYAKRLGALDDIPRLRITKEQLSKNKLSDDEKRLLSMIDGVASFGDLLRSTPLGRFDSYRIFVRFLEQGWLDTKNPTGTWDLDEILPGELLRLLPDPSPQRPTPAAAIPKVEVAVVTKTEPKVPPPPLVVQPPANGNYDDFFYGAVAAYLQKNYGAAKEMFDRCSQLRPGDRRALHNLQRLKAHN